MIRPIRISLPLAQFHKAKAMTAFQSIVASVSLPTELKPMQSEVKLKQRLSEGRSLSVNPFERENYFDSRFNLIFFRY